MNTGIPKDFADETIRRILQNKAYKGVLQYQKGNRVKMIYPQEKHMKNFQECGNRLLMMIYLIMSYWMHLKVWLWIQLD